MDASTTNPTLPGTRFCTEIGLSRVQQKFFGPFGTGNDAGALQMDVLEYFSRGREISQREPVSYYSHRIPPISQGHCVRVRKNTDA